MLTSNKLRLESGTGSHALQLKYSNMVQSTDYRVYGVQITYITDDKCTTVHLSFNVAWLSKLRSLSLSLTVVHANATNHLPRLGRVDSTGLQEFFPLRKMNARKKCWKLAMLSKILQSGRDVAI